MKTKLLKRALLALACFLVSWGWSASGEGGPLTGLTLSKLEKQASERVTITLDKPMLEFAAKFLSKDDPDTEQVRNIVKNLEGIYVRVFEFKEDKAYTDSDLAGIRRQLGSDWSRMVEVRGDENVDFYVKRDGDKIKGFVLICAEPRELVLVHVAGSIRPEQLSELEGFAGIPKGILHSDKSKSKAKEKARPAIDKDKGADKDKEKAEDSEKDNAEQ